MPTIPNSQLNHVEVLLYGSIASAGSNQKNTVNAFHYRLSVSVPTLDKTAFYNAFHVTVATPFAAMLNLRWTLQHSTVRWLDDATDAPTLFSLPLTGGVTGDSMVMSVSAFIEKKTQLRGKHYRGGWKFGPMSESDTTPGADDVLNTAALARLNTFAGGALQMLTDANGNQWKPCLYSRKLSQHLVNPTTIVTNDLAALAIRKTLGRMKKRIAKSVY